MIHSFLLMPQINELKVMNRGGRAKCGHRSECLLSPEDTALCSTDSLTVVIS